MQWTGRGAAYADSYAHLCAHTAPDLLDAAGLTPGARLLDAGTGTGTVAALALERGAVVTAVDAEPSMVALAGARVTDVRLGHLPDLPFPDASFDAVVANFVVNHVPDPGRAVADLARVAVPGGRVALTVWPQPSPPLQQLWNDVLAAIGLAAAPKTVNFPRTPDGVAGLLEGAGLRDVTCRTLSWSHRADLESWWIGPANGMGALGEALAGQSAAVRAAARREYDRLAAPYLDGASLTLPTSALLGRGTRA